MRREKDNIASCSGARLTVQEQLRLEKTQRDALDALRRAQRHTNDTIDVGADTSRKLGQQSETLHRIDDTLDRAEYELKVSDRILRGMSGIGGTIASWFTRAPRPPPASMPRAERGGGALTPPPASRQQVPPRSSQLHSEPDGRGSSPRPNAAGGLGRGPKKSPQAAATGTQPDDVGACGDYSKKIDEGLDALLRDMETIKGQSQLHSHVLDEQNRKLDAIAGKTDHVDLHMKQTRRKVQNLM